MQQYGDESFIHAMARIESEEQDKTVPNDIKNGYVVIRDENIPFSEREIIEGRLYMTIPSDFGLMPPELARVKYPSENRPDIIFSDEEGAISINFSLTGDKLQNEDIEDAKDYLQQVVLKMNPSSRILSSEIIEDETRIGYFDFISPAIDGEIYNLMFIFSLDGQFILGTFNCMDMDKAQWLEIAVQMIHSIRITEDKI